VSERTTGIYWVPLALGAGLLLVSVPLTNLSPSIGARGNAIAIVAGLALLVVAGLMAYRMKTTTAEPLAGRGGDAVVDGSSSSATGGPGGNSERGQGGRGGDATVSGNRSSATGGRGGDA
jgi:hypothetical protein